MLMFEIKYEFFMFVIHFYLQNIFPSVDTYSENRCVKDDIVFNNMCENPVYDMILNGSITESEIIDAIQNLKNGKAAGIDNFVTEYNLN